MISCFVLHWYGCIFDSTQDLWVGSWSLSVPALKNTSTILDCKNYRPHPSAWSPLQWPGTNGRIPHLPGSIDMHIVFSYFSSGLNLLEVYFIPRYSRNWMHNCLLNLPLEGHMYSHNQVIPIILLGKRDLSFWCYWCPIIEPRISKMYLPVLFLKTSDSIIWFEYLCID